MTFFQANWNFGLEGHLNTRWSSPRRGAFGGRCFPLLVIAGGAGGAGGPVLPAAGPLQPAVGEGPVLLPAVPGGVRGGGRASPPWPRCWPNDKGPAPAGGGDRLPYRPAAAVLPGAATTPSATRATAGTCSLWPPGSGSPAPLEFRCTERGYFRIEEAGVAARDLFLTQKYLGSFPQHTEFLRAAQGGAGGAGGPALLPDYGGDGEPEEDLRRPLRLRGPAGLCPGRPHEVHQLEGHRPGGEDADQPPRVHPEPAGGPAAGHGGGGRPPQRGFGAAVLRPVPAPAGGGREPGRLQQRDGRRHRGPVGSWRACRAGAASCT